MFGWFRRFPLKWLERIPVPGLRESVVYLYKQIDRDGVVSDFLADPQILYEKWWPYRTVRKRLFAGPEPLVSVVVATHNNRQTIESAIRSLLSQTHRNLEIIVVDDASSDGTGDVVQSLQQEDSRVVLLRNSRQLGTGRSRNRAMKAARGTYLTFQDGDDYSLPARIEMQVHAFVRHPRKTLVTCNYVRVTEAGNRIQVNDKRVMECMISMMFPREIVLEKIGFFDNLGVSEDTDYRERIKITFGPNCRHVVFRTLYHALFRQNSSLFSDVRILEYDGRKVRYDRDTKAAEAYAKIKARHDLMRKGRKSTYIPASDH